MAKRKPRKKSKKPPGPVEPPMVPFSVAWTVLGGAPISSIVGRYEGNFSEGFASYTSARPANLDERRVGRWQHLETSYRNSFVADHALRELPRLIESRGGNPMANARANDAGINVLRACHLLNSAAILHVRADRNTHFHGLVLTRSALECVGRAALIATGSSDEINRWRTETVTAKQCIDALAPVLVAKTWIAAPVGAVYAWLCNFTHMNYRGLEHLQSKDAGARDDSYCGYAYTCWAAAVLAEIVTGVPDLAEYPIPLPIPLPWDR